jgi:hypothetical protein
MNKKVLIIGGGIVVIGAGAYLYFMNKSKKEALLSGSATPTTSGATTPTTSGATTPTTTDNLPKGTIITPSSDGGITPLAVTIPSQTKPTIQNQEELDRIMDSIKKNMELSRKMQLSIAMWTPSNAFKASGGQIDKKPLNPYPTIIEKLKNDLLKLGYEVKEGSNGIFLVKL